MPVLDDILAENIEQSQFLLNVTILLQDILKQGGGKGAAKAKAGDKKGDTGGFFDELRGAASSLAKITAVAAGFTYAFNPSLVNQLGQTFAGLAATIGSILQPIIETAIPVISEVSGIILELADSLRPLIDLLATSVGEVFVSAVRAAADVLAALMPVIEPIVKALAIMFNVLSAVITVLSALFRAIMSAIGGLLGITSADVSDALTDFKNLLYEAVRAVATFAAEVLEFAGAMETLAKFRDNLAKTIADMKKPKEGLKAAPVGATTSGIEDIARKFAEKAFTASAGAKAKDPNTALLDAIHKDLEEIIRRGGMGGIRGRAEAAEDRVFRAVGAPGALSVFDVSAVPGPPRGVGAFADDIAAAAAAAGGR